MTYEETLEYLYASAPLFQQVGADAYKEGLGTTLALDSHFNHPHLRYRTIHVGGTNGKGSCAHTLAAILQASGLKTGLYTSPHLVDFRERIRINGQMIPHETVIRFVECERTFFEPLHPSFFELTTALAFNYFAEQEVDVAVIEVGLGGRLDCTNIIRPVFSLITNISLDHTSLLGSTPAAIAAEKAGIIKPSTPVVIGETDTETRPVFTQAAEVCGAPIIFAEDSDNDGLIARRDIFALKGDCQKRNLRTLIACLPLLRKYFGVTDTHIKEGLRNVIELTGGPRGRWERHGQTILDTGHNPGGWQYLAPRLAHMAAEKTLHIVFGCAEDKDVDTILSLLPSSARYYWTQAGVRRALAAEKLARRAATFGLAGDAYADVPSAYRAAIAAAGQDTEAILYVGGSCFVVADWLDAFGN